MKFEKELKTSVKKQGGNKKLVIGIIIGVVVLALIVLPMILGGLK